MKKPRLTPKKLSKMPPLKKTVWVVVCTSPDIAKRFVEICGIHKDIESARRHRQQLWNLVQVDADILQYTLMDGEL